MKPLSIFSERTPISSHLPDRQAVTALLVNAGLIGLWIWLYRAVFPYLGVIFTEEQFRTNQIVLVIVLGLIVLQLRKGGLALRLNRLPQFYLPATGFVLGGSILYLLAERYLNINTLSATLFGLGTYGLLGLWLPAERWRQGLPAALLLIGALPFGAHMETFVGYPVRIATAAIVRDGLAALGVHSIGVDTILVFENGISKVDLPCSGVKSLWTGGLFFLAASWVDRRPVNLRWLAAGLGFACLLLAANLVRVGILVVVGQALGWRLAAEIIHVPLGILGFAGACGAALVMLRWAGTLQAALAEPTAQSRPVWLAPGLAVAISLMALLYAPRPAAPAPQPQKPWTFPSALAVTEWPMSPSEQQWLAQSEVTAGERWRFEWRGIQGSILMVESATWRAHHRPERCFEVYGLSTDQSNTLLAAPNFPLRALSLGNAKKRNLYSAVYWLQSASQTTDDYATRIWDDLSPQRQNWVLVTVLFDGNVDLKSADMQDLFITLRDVVNLRLKGK